MAFKTLYAGSEQILSLYLYSWLRSKIILFIGFLALRIYVNGDRFEGTELVLG